MVGHRPPCVRPLASAREGIDGGHWRPRRSGPWPRLTHAACDARPGLFQGAARDNLSAGQCHCCDRSRHRRHLPQGGSMRKDQEGHVTLETQEARSGETSGHIRLVLIVGTILAIVGMIVTLVIWK